MATAGITKKRLIAECALYEHGLRSPQGTYPGDLASYRPGQTNNPETDVSGWFVYYGQLRAAHARQSSQPEKNSDERALADLAGVGVITEAPLTQLSKVAREDGSRRTLTVYPKSFVTLVHLHGRDLALARLQPMIKPLFEHPDFKPTLLRSAISAIAEEQLLCVWIVTTPGVGMPFDPEQDPPAPPESLQYLHPLEVEQILTMHLTVNYRHLAVARALLTPDTEGHGHQFHWSPFWAQASEVLGESPTVLTRHRSLLSVLYQMQLLGSAQRDAKQRAEERGDDA